jgi:hypothetical protein
MISEAAEFTVPALLVTEILPVVAPVGTVTCIDDIDETVNVAALPFIFTEEIPEKFDPLTVITVLAVALPIDGVKVLIIGSGNFIAGHPLMAIFVVVVCVEVVQTVFAVTTVVIKVNDAVLVDAGFRLNVLSVIFPFVAEVGAFATMWPLTTENDWADTPLNLTAVTRSGALV